MIGGFNQCEDKAGCQEKVTSCCAAINAKNGCNATSYTVDKCFSQVVAGTNWWAHCKCSNGKEWSVCMFEPLPHTGNPCTVELVEEGWKDARCPNS